MKRYKYIRDVLYLNGYTTEIPTSLELIDIDVDKWLIYQDENGKVVKARYDTTAPVDATTDITISGSTSVLITTGGTYQLRVLNEDNDNVTTACTFTLSNTGVATVGAATGLITGLITGSTTISVTHPEYGATATATVRVSTITIGGAFSVASGATHQIAVTDELGTNVTAGCTFVSATPAKATVSAGGLITGVATGTSVITVTHTTSGAVVKATATVTT